MRLADLHPDLVQTPGGLLWLSFDCPKCGRPRRVTIPVVLNMEPQDHPPRWGMMISIPDAEWRTTISPSINSATHGRKYPCGWHGHVIDGEVRP